MDIFERTPSGKKSAYQFRDETLVWVEGPTDIPIFDELLRGLDCKVKPIRGKNRFKEVKKGIIEDDLPYAIVVDGDYDILTKSRSSHRRIVWLYRYSVENYFFEKEIFVDITEHLIRSQGSKTVDTQKLRSELSSLFDDVAAEVRRLKSLVLLDIADHIEGNGEDILPGHIKRLLDEQDLEIKIPYISDLVDDLQKKPSIESINEARECLNNFCQDNRFDHIVRGKMLFQLIKLLISYSVSKYRGSSFSVGTESFLLILSRHFSAPTNSTDHRSLKQRLRRAVRDA